VYIVAFCGIYTIFYGYRSRGDYLTELEDIKGVATQRPFLSVALLIFMISLIGTPPLLGFLGKLSVINSMIVGKEFVLVGAILVAMLILVYAYLKIITVVYFEARNKNFDEVDKGVYICMLINIILILIAIINPKYLMHDVEMMLIAVFK
jgi:NADH-quinone oxidoreductase subunit N